MNGKVPLASKINVLGTLKIRNKDKVMGLVPEDYQIYRNLGLIDNEGNQKVELLDLDEEDEEPRHEEIEDKLYKWYGLLLDKMIVDRNSY